MQLAAMLAEFFDVLALHAFPLKPLPPLNMNAILIALLIHRHLFSSERWRLSSAGSVRHIGFCATALALSAHRPPSQPNRPVELPLAVG